MIFDWRIYTYLMRRAKTMDFVCEWCKNGEHCKRHDTWCDCQCREKKGTDVPKPE